MDDELVAAAGFDVAALQADQALGEHGVVETTFDEWIRRAQIDDQLESLVHDDDLEEILVHVG